MRKLSLSKLAALAAVALTASVGFATGASATHNRQPSCPALNAIDPDSDGSMNIVEALIAGNTTFRKLNTDNDWTLEAKELKGRLTLHEMKTVDPDNDGSLDIFEWKRMVKGLFKAANTDGDWTIECDELQSPAGRALVRVLH